MDTIDTKQSAARVIAVAVVWALLLGAAGGALTPLGPWYYDLIQPGWKPPDFAFGPAWTTIFALSAYAGVRAWHGSNTDAERRLVVVLFAVNSLANMVWSLLFFTLQRPDWSLLEIVPLWLSIVALMIGLKGRHPHVVLALSPYLMWVSFAGFLNKAVVDLNGPFG